MRIKATGCARREIKNAWRQSARSLGFAVVLSPRSGLGDRCLKAEEGLSVQAVFESFCASRASGRQRPGHVASGQTCSKVLTSHVLVQEAGIEAVSSAHGIDSGHFQRSARK